MSWQWLQDHAEAGISALGGAAVTSFLSWLKIGRLVDRNDVRLGEVEEDQENFARWRTAHMRDYARRLEELVRLGVQVKGVRERVDELTKHFERFLEETRDERRRSEEKQHELVQAILSVGKQMRDSVQDLKERLARREEDEDDDE